MKLPSAIIFDGDGVVFDTEELSIHTFIKTVKTYDIVYRRDQCGRFIGCGTTEALRLIRDEHGMNIDQIEYIARREKIYEQSCDEANGPCLMPGIVDLLDWLDERDIPFAIASSASPWKLNFNLERTGLLPRFPTKVNGDEVTRGKPAPDIFEEAARRLGVDIRECIVVEDSVNGLKGAREAGADCIAIEGSHSNDELGVYTDRIFKNPGEMLAWLKSTEKKFIQGVKK